MPYFFETRSYASGPAPPALSAALSSRKNRSNPARRHHRQEATRSWHHASVRVRHLPRGEHDCTGTCGKLVVTDLEHVLSLDHVEELVLIRVYVKGSIERIHLFDDRERTSGGLCARFDEEDRSRKRQAFSSHGGEMEAGGAITPDHPNLACGDHLRTGPRVTGLAGYDAWTG